MPFSFPEDCKYVDAMGPITAAGGEVTSLPVSLKNVHRLWAIVDVNTAGTSAAIAMVPQTDSAVAFGSPAVLTTAVPIWVNVSVAVNLDQYTQATPAVNYTTVGDALRKSVIFEIDPAILAAGEDCFRISITALAAGDYAHVGYVIQPRYPSRVATSPSVAVD